MAFQWRPQAATGTRHQYARTAERVKWMRAKARHERSRPGESARSRPSTANASYRGVEDLGISQQSVLTPKPESQRNRHSPSKPSAHQQAKTPGSSKHRRFNSARRGRLEVTIGNSFGNNVKVTTGPQVTLPHLVNENPVVLPVVRLRCPARHGRARHEATASQPRIIKLATES